MRWPLALAIALFALPARAQDSPDRVRAAEREYDEGRRLYLENQFEQAAIHFENAFVDAPRAEPLRNAIRARRAAKQLARAATLAEVAIAQYEDPQTKQLAREILAEASPKVHSLILACDPKCGVSVDGHELSLADARVQHVFLDPGSHDLSVTFGERIRQVKFDAKAGGKTELSMKPPDDSAPAPPPVVTKPPPDEAPREASGKPFGPVVFIVLAGLTAIGAGATIVSGIDAQNNPGADAVRRDCAGQGESCPEYQKGRDAQLRTNILLAGTIGLAAVTAAVGVFLTEWSSPKPSAARVRLGPSLILGNAVGAGVSGAF